MVFVRLAQTVLLLTLLLLTGCVEYDLDIQFDSQTHGQMVQQFHWAGTAPPQQFVAWQSALAERVQTVGGTVKWADGTTATATVPFNNGAELEQRFNQLFAEGDSGLVLPGGETVSATLKLAQGNWIFAIRNHLAVTFDLTAVPTGKRLGTPVLEQVEVLTGQVNLTTPWGINSVKADGAETGGKSAYWPLYPGQVNPIEADFWVPSPIGIGAAAIALLVTVGYSLRYRFGIGGDASP
ncbi:MAG: DUF3153 domain-containing protein [Leptolyngbyaceae cyanobacterium]